MSRNPQRHAASALSVAAEMAARAHVTRAALVVLGMLAQLNYGDEISCSEDGLFADYETACREYVRCAGGGVRARYACPAGRAFSEALAACVPRAQQPCVRARCGRGDTRAHAAPGAACREYYRCGNGTARRHACPPGAWFDVERQACGRGAGTCYEPVCAGLPDGLHADPSDDCRRELRCAGGELREVRGCEGRCAAACRPPREAAVALPAGDADFCADETCASLCERAADGGHADRGAGCREYFVCEAGRVVRRGVCEPGHLFADGGCRPAAAVRCPAPARSACFNRADGARRDWRGCGAWLACRRGRVAARGDCGAGQAFDGAACVPAAEFPCEGPAPAAECAGLPSGTYADAASNCSRYFHCEGSLRTLLWCPAGQMFDGARCVAAAAAVCASLAGDSCWRRPDGRYRAAGAGCRGYYACAAGDKALYACPPGGMFDGAGCVPRGERCDEDDACRALSDGYHADLESQCTSYFYCEGGDRLATLSCLGGKIFDGQACVDPLQHKCGDLRAAGEECTKDGFFVQRKTNCSKYFFCVSGARTSLTCPQGQMFNGQICVPNDQYTCPD